ncbi:MAG: hypothetical protein JNL69_12125 [Bacteroidia bacterium]|nr:hypothetical protein [Bacteroidia bacterium]
MKTLQNKSALFVLAVITGLILVSGSSCKKDEKCRGKVKVIDTAAIAVGNALVKIHAPSVNGQVSYTGFTDGGGFVSFEVKLPAIFDVEATKGSYPGMVGRGILRLDEPGKEADVTVILKP